MSAAARRLIDAQLCEQVSCVTSYAALAGNQLVAARIFAGRCGKDNVWVT